MVHIGIFELLKISLKKIKDELLIFGVFAILVSLAFTQFSVWVLIIFCLASGTYLIKIFLLSRFYSVNSNHSENFSKFTASKHSWEKRIIDNYPVYFYTKDNNYKIEQSHGCHKSWDTSESWMKLFPDQHISEYKVYLKHNETKIKELLFLSCDGGRYFIPLPNKRVVKNSRSIINFEYYWVKNSLEFQVGEIIGNFYNEVNLVGVANLCKIKILN